MQRPRSRPARFPASGSLNHWASLAAGKRIAPRHADEDEPVRAAKVGQPHWRRYWAKAAIGVDHADCAGSGGLATARHCEPKIGGHVEHARWLAELALSERGRRQEQAQSVSESRSLPASLTDTICAPLPSCPAAQTLFIYLYLYFFASFASFAPLANARARAKTVSGLAPLKSATGRVHEAQIWSARMQT